MAIMASPSPISRAGGGVGAAVWVILRPRQPALQPQGHIDQAEQTGTSISGPTTPARASRPEVAPDSPMADDAIASSKSLLAAEKASAAARG